MLTDMILMLSLALAQGWVMGVLQLCMDEHHVPADDDMVQ